MATSDPTSAPTKLKGDMIQDWRPEDEQFWESTGKSQAWKTLWLTTFGLILSFSTWFMVSAMVVKLTGIGYKFDKSQLFWLNAMPGLAAGTLRIIHTFLIPVFGTRKTVAWSTLSLLIPCIGWGYAVQDPNTSFGTFLILGFLAGLGGGNFSSFMPSTSLFFPKRLQGTALGIQAGIGNFGVSLVQFLVPVLIGISMVGSSQHFVDKKGDKVVKEADIFLQNSAFFWIPFVVIAGLCAYFMLKSVPVKANFKEQTDIFKDKHTWNMTALYFMTFGSFSGFSAAFPMLIKESFGKFEGAPDPLKLAFLGPLIGATIRVVFGPISDKLGGSKVTMLSAIGLIACALAITQYTHPTGMEQWNGFFWLMLGIFLFSGIGNASTFKQMPMIFPPRQAGGVIGWTSAIAAYGPFVFNVSFAAIFGSVGHSTPFFYAAAVFYVICLFINWNFYMRKGAERPC